MAEAIAMKANTEAEKVVLRAVIKRGDAGMKYYECPCGWFYSGARCPDKTCVKWKKENGTKRIKLYAHESSEGWYDDGKKMGLEGDALRNFAHWGEEIEFDAEVNLETGEVKLLTVDGHKIFPVKG